VIDDSQGKVTIRWTSTGTHRGEFAGIAPTNRVITFHGIEIIRVKDGQIAERWGEWDGEAIFAQLRRP
jgi:predicted ester cyclase